ncbi:hypothetical protein BDN72DRAFT_876247 [Pluteus cervinus]|uniref:Uncharacterized protein n=1 Tax=Pluteus cervinus TaxID=181527 RepID=A0ACD3B4W4_9AGAR|nr:hypothetical protein BDN72DRAFT_876247 [Pluteus cervinus]
MLSALGPRFPIELMDLIFSCLVGDAITLARCLFLGKMVFDICHRYLYRVVVIRMPIIDSQSTRGYVDKFTRFWTTSRDLIKYVRKLVVISPHVKPQYGSLLGLFDNHPIRVFKFIGPSEPNRSVGLAHLALFAPFLSGWSAESLEELDLTGTHVFPTALLVHLKKIRRLRFCPGTSIAHPWYRWSPANLDSRQLPAEECVSIPELELEEPMSPETWFYLTRCINYSRLQKLEVRRHCSLANHDSKELQKFLELAAPFVDESSSIPPDWPCVYDHHMGINLAISEVDRSPPYLDTGRQSSGASSPEFLNSPSPLRDVPQGAGTAWSALDIYNGCITTS